MVIGLVLTLAVTSIVTVGEAQKRSTTSTNDMDQAGAYASYVLDRALRSAGSGLTQSIQPTDRGVFGCKLIGGRAAAGHCCISGALQEKLPAQRHGQPARCLVPLGERPAERRSPRRRSSR